MKAVDPIRDIKKVNAMKTYLRGKDIRDYTMFILGINIALRISDLLQLKWSDVLKDDMKNFKDIHIVEKKTKKERKIKLNKSSQKALKELLYNLETCPIDDYIFKSREGNNKPITRQQALNILKSAAKAVGVEDNIGTHTLRKTWGYHAWKNGFNPALIMETLNHSNLSVTKRYLGIRQDDINDLYDSLNI
ncbi:tyrosine-type recombinase/integrase [Clostridium sp. D2Q-14]|uniref:tyrosine-type recombinase/integrase n=1 Tax=Anaeromonas gelatinilytica TaxID=2683194 RepID=UPI00193B106B|nr:tyrosine-type recombinase/integrase [Anaeromonas gelatinilytica]MBS4536497.1 tyrosine-type recombinase/integrase [Anaeromonas gelatinilytica]